jgi:Ni,Fe-hydrogenase I large subunit
LPPEVNLIAVAHYLDALEWQKDIVKIHPLSGSGVVASESNDRLGAALTVM